MTSNLNDTFVALIQAGVESVKSITDPKDKAIASAELAKAIASTGLVVMTGDMIVNETAESVEKAKTALKEGDSGKTTTKKKAAAKKKEAPEPVKIKEVQKPEVKKEEPEEAEEVDPSEWTDEALEKYAAELENINNIAEEFGDETINECIQGFSEGHYSTLEDITPLNIIGFNTYINELMKEASEG